MYVAHQLLAQARSERTRLGDQAGAALRGLAEVQFEEFDADLPAARVRAEAHNQTRNGEAAAGAASAESLGSVLGFLQDVASGQDPSRGKRRKAQSVDDALRLLDDCYAAGDSSQLPCYYLMAAPPSGQWQRWYELLKHPYHRVRHASACGLLLDRNRRTWLTRWAATRRIREAAERLDDQAVRELVMEALDR